MKEKVVRLNEENCSIDEIKKFEHLRVVAGSGHCFIIDSAKIGNASNFNFGIKNDFVLFSFWNVNGEYMATVSGAYAEAASYIKEDEE